MSRETPIKIAIVDDHALFRKGLAEILSGFSNITLLFDAKNGKELLAAIADHKEQPDICIVDINMPVMNGYETTRHIRSTYPKIKVLALSMYDNEFNIIKMLQHGANGYVLKDAEPDELYSALQAIKKEGFYHSDIITNTILKESKVAENGDIAELTKKELEFLKYTCTEMTYREIATKMGVSPRTIDGYRDSLFIKLNIRSRTGLVIYAIKWGLVSIY